MSMCKKQGLTGYHVNRVNMVPQNTHSTIYSTHSVASTPVAQDMLTDPHVQDSRQPDDPGHLKLPSPRSRANHGPLNATCQSPAVHVWGSHALGVSSVLHRQTATLRTGPASWFSGRHNGKARHWCRTGWLQAGASCFDRGRHLMVHVEQPAVHLMD